MTASARPHVLSDLTWPASASSPFDVVVLPWGATEPHNRHLPHGTDTLVTEAVAAESARRATARGARVVVLPAIPFGVQTTQRDLALAINLNPSTQLAILCDIARSLDGHGVKKLVLLNGHGGNDFRALIRELVPETRLHLSLVNWWQVEDARPYFAEPGDHAGELETSVMLHLAPDLVRPLDEAGPGRARTASIPALRDGWAWAPRPWSAVTDDTGVGDPRQATAASGQRFFNVVCDKIAEYLAQLAACDPVKLYTDTGAPSGGAPTNADDKG